MKIYTNEINLNQPSDKAFWVAPHSDYKIGVKLTENGNAIALSSISLYDGDAQLSADDGNTNGFKTFTRKSDSGTKILDVKVNGQKKSKITENVSNSTVYDTDEKGSYALPTASTSTLGGVKIGNGISIDGDGKISASGVTIKHVLLDEDDQSLIVFGDDIDEGDYVFFYNYWQTEGISANRILYKGNVYSIGESSIGSGFYYVGELSEESAIVIAGCGLHKTFEFDGPYTPPTE